MREKEGFRVMRARIYHLQTQRWEKNLVHITGCGYFKDYPPVGIRRGARPKLPGRRCWYPKTRVHVLAFFILSLLSDGLFPLLHLYLLSVTWTSVRFYFALATALHDTFKVFTSRLMELGEEEEKRWSWDEERDHAADFVCKCFFLECS